MSSSKMEVRSGIMSKLLGRMATFLRRCIFCILSIGPIPSHLAFIMDGNRRFAKRENLKDGAGHRAGFLALVSLLKYCYELGVKYVSVYAFSIDNFRRRPNEVRILMDLMLEKSEGMIKEESIINEYGVRVCFVGNLKLFSEPVQAAAEKVMRATANNSKCVLLICLAYTSTDEIRRAVQESCKDKWNKIESSNSAEACNGEIEEVDDDKKINSALMNGVHESLKDEADKSHLTNARPVCNGVTKRVGGAENTNGIQESFGDKFDEAQALEGARNGNAVIPVEKIEKIPSCTSIKLVDIEKHMYMSIAPDPDILIRTSGETRLSNFLLWQTSFCQLYSPDTLWPEIGLWQVIWATLIFQRYHFYLEKKKKQS